MGLGMFYTGAPGPTEPPKPVLELGDCFSADCHGCQSVLLVESAIREEIFPLYAADC